MPIRSRIASRSCSGGTGGGTYGTGPGHARRPPQSTGVALQRLRPGFLALELGNRLRAGVAAAGRTALNVLPPGSYREPCGAVAEQNHGLSVGRKRAGHTPSVRLARARAKAAGVQLRSALPWTG